MKKWICATAVLLFLFSLVAVGFAQSPCSIQDEEEYAVMAAVLFPNPPDIPDDMKDDVQRKAYQAKATVRLDGFHGGSYTIEDETTASKITKGADPVTVDDFNRKNEKACKIAGVKLLARIPAGKRVTVISAEEVRSIFASPSGKGGGWDEFRKRYPFAGEIAYLSRPGFNPDRTKAVMEVRMQAGYEMGVGYRVYLEKSSKTGKWIIVDRDMSHMS